jgi:kynurenine formamidase
MWRWRDRSVKLRASVRVIDLSIPIDAATPFYPGDPEPRVSPITSAARPGFNVSRLELGSHSGTHCDAPYHFMETGLRIHELPLERFVGPGVLVDLVGIEARESIGWDLLAPHEAELEPYAIVLLFTGWASRRHHPTYFDHPYLAGDACARLLSLGVRTIGIDALSLDETPNAGSDRAAFDCHEAIARAGGVIVENLTNLGALRGHTRPTISVLPLSLPGADAAPTRAVALLDD